MIYSRKFACPNLPVYLGSGQEDCGTSLKKKFVAAYRRTHRPIDRLAGQIKLGPVIEQQISNIHH